MKEIINLDNGFIYGKEDYTNGDQSEYSIILKHGREIINAIVYSSKSERDQDFNQIGIQLRNQLQDLIFFK